MQCEELREVVGDDYWVWVSQYLVMKRASIENNFHTLYSLFLDQLKLNSVNVMVIRETLRNIKVSESHLCWIIHAFDAIGAIEVWSINIQVLY